jgi:single-strand DNA-binding protein
MNESHITVHGYVAATPIVRKVGEHSVANFRIGVTPRRLEKATGAWHDAETQWYAVSAWRALGENVAASLRKGDPVIVQGRLTARTWVNAQHAEVVAHDIEATVVGHDLRRGVTTFYKTAPPTAAQAEQEGPSTEGYDEVPDDRTLPGDLQDLIAGTGEPAPESAGPADWNAPLSDAPSFAGAA